MGILDRLQTLVKANVNDLIDKAEDPQKLLKQIIRELEDAADAGKADAARLLADAMRAEQEVERKARDVDDWQKRAELALREGQEDLARKALERKLATENELRGLEEQTEQIRQSAETIKEEVRRLSAKAEEVRTRLHALHARQEAAQTMDRSRQALHRLTSPQEGAARLERLERHVSDLERETDARRMLDQELATQEQDDKQLLELERKAAVDAELAALRARL